VYQLTEPSPELEEQYNEYIDEWEKTGERIIPTAVKREGRSYDDLLAEWKTGETDQVRRHGWVPASVYFLMDSSRKIYGAVQIRHELNEHLLKLGGHIGYGVRPTERRKGLATTMLALSLDKAKAIGLERVLITCDKNNIGSAKTIMKNGGVLEDEIVDEGRVTQRYWIAMKQDKT
jgi:Predicted acetyltransferase